MVSITINDLSYQFIQIFLKDEELNLLYSYAVHTNHSSFIGFIFQQDHILVENNEQYLSFCRQVFETLSIAPKLMRNEEWFSALMRLRFIGHQEA